MARQSTTVPMVEPREIMELAVEPRRSLGERAERGGPKAAERSVIEADGERIGERSPTESKEGRPREGDGEAIVAFMG